MVKVTEVYDGVRTLDQFEETNKLEGLSVLPNDRQPINNCWFSNSEILKKTVDWNPTNKIKVNIYAAQSIKVDFEVIVSIT